MSCDEVSYAAAGDLLCSKAVIVCVQVLKVHSFMDRIANVSKGCGIVEMADHSSAQAAIDGLNGLHTMEVPSPSLLVFPSP